MAKRKTVTITIDEDLWRISGALLPCSRSKFIENQLREYINSNNEIEQLEKEVEKEKQQIQAKEEKIRHLKEIRELNNHNKEVIFKAMNTVRDIVFNIGAISKSQIEFIASNNTIDSDVLTAEIKKEGIKITEFTQDYKNRSDRNLKLE